MPTLWVGSIAASAGHGLSRSACMGKQRRGVGNKRVRGDTVAAARGGEGGGGVGIEDWL